MNDIAIDNINRILNNEIALGHAVIGVISVDDDMHISICWRTDDPAKRNIWEQALDRGIKSVGRIQELIPLPKIA